MSDPLGSGSGSSQPGLWLGLSIAATLLCCLPLGVPGIVFAAMAMDANGRGDWVTASQRTEQAKTWTLWSFGVGLAVIVVYVCFIGLATSRTGY